MSDWIQVDEGRRKASLRPIAMLACEPAELTARFGLRFAAEGHADSTAALIQTASGRQYMLLRHHDAPAVGTELLAPEDSGDPRQRLIEFLQAFGLDRHVVTWSLAEADGGDGSPTAG